MARIRTLDFLPEIFQTPTNRQFLSATLDQLVNPPVTKRIEGYIGSKFGYGINANDNYVPEPTKIRQDYQLEPGVVFTKENESVAKDFISYPGILNALKLQGGLVDDNNRLFNSEFYSWDSFTNLDKIINFTEYYWLPDGLPAVTVASDIVFTTTDYIVTDLPNSYDIRPVGAQAGSQNPTITLLRGGSYNFLVNQDTSFWIQTEPGVSGTSLTQPNLSVRDVFGVDNNGASQGSVIFNVPQKNAQNQFLFPGNLLVDVVSNKAFNEVNGLPVSQVQNIDGISITALEGLTVMFYNNITNETANLGAYDVQLYDQDTIEPLLTIGYDDNNVSTPVNAYFYKIYLIPNPSNTLDPTVQLVPFFEIPVEQKITASFGTQFNGLTFYKSSAGPIERIPLITAPLDILYYQDGSNPNKVGVIRLIESNRTNTLNVETEILGKKTFTSRNGIQFTNGLKVQFDGDVIPTSYLEGQYYVEGVGTGIQLIPVTELIAPEAFTTNATIPYDSTPYDIGGFDGESYIPFTPDYITIARNSFNRNAWSRSNRWFHSQVINATAQYNNNPEIAIQYATIDNKAKRPIIEFYPNLRLFDSGTEGKDPIDFIDTRTTDAFSFVAGQENYYPDVETYTAYEATVEPIDSTSATITIDSEYIYGSFKLGQYVADLAIGEQIQLPQDTRIIDITGTETITLTVQWTVPKTIVTMTDVSIVATPNNVNNYILFPGARIVFVNDTDEDVRNKIYVVNYSLTEFTSYLVITLTEASDGELLLDNQVFALRGYNYSGKSFYYNGERLVFAQQKLDVNQPPLFDIFDKNGISFGDTDVYVGTSFKGCTLFAYGIGTGLKDSILGFPLKYSSISNLGDISFDVSLNLDTFDYVTGTDPITQKVNTGYIYNYNTRLDYTRQIGWQTAVAPSTQYQIFEFDYEPSSITLPDTIVTTTVTCDVAKLDQEEILWPTLEVYVNNVLQPNSNYTVNVENNRTTITVALEQDITTKIQVLILSNQVSKQAYYSIPINLSNNPFNTDITTANIGDIRGQYQSIFTNNPDVQGVVFGSNNTRDLGNLVPWGNRIIQNSASLALPAAFLRQPNHNLFDALLFNSREYIKFKTLLVDTVDKTDYTQRYDASYMLDDALDQITSNKSEEQSFFWSDMLPSKAPFVTNTYEFKNNLDSAIFPLYKVYNFDTANYDGVLVYINRTVLGINFTKQLIKGVDYIVSEDSPSLTIISGLIAGDKVIIKEYNQTYGSYIPNTPTKLGLYPATIPGVVLDDAYLIPTYFIVGHDGSYNRLYGDYDPVTGLLVDFRDQVLLEFETRVYNNLKLSNTIPVQEYELVPGFFRDNVYSFNEWTQIYSINFLDWIGQNRLDYKQQLYNAGDQYTYNYRDSGNKINNSVIPMGYWRGIYQYFYDTTTPDQTPWQMIGYRNQPTWWTDRYGPAPYTSDNIILWQDMADGYDYNNGDPRIIPELVRPNLLKILPVDGDGNLKAPLDCVIGNYDPNIFQRNWRVGDDGPVELSYRRSSTWPFDFMRLVALTKPAQFFNLGADLDNYKYNEEFNQYLVNDRQHLVPNQIEIYGNGIAKTSYINWIVDYEKQLGVNATQNIKDLLFNLDVRLVYRLAGYSDKTLLKFFVEKGTPNSSNASLLIPDESYSILLYENQPIDRIVYSGVIIQIVPNGYAVYGNSQNNAFFRVLKPVNNGKNTNIKIQDLSVKVANDYTEQVDIVPYGTIFYSPQAVAQFLMSYGKYLESQGLVFEDIEGSIEINWQQMVAEYLYWSQMGWENGSVTTLNPAAKSLTINKESQIVQPLTFAQSNFILNQNLYPIQNVDLSIVRDETVFNVKPQNQGDTIAYGQFNMSNFEHGIVFDNVTLFSDVIYNLITGLRQNRINVRGTKSAEWNGTVTASGFIYNQDNVEEWKKELKYTKGSIVRYKNKFWTATKIIQPAQLFNERDWKETEYDEIQKGLLPNSSTRSYESSLYYNIDKANLEQDADQLSFSLIGYRPRDYMALADLTDITQVNVYKNMIKDKGTRNALSAFKGVNLPQGGIDYEIYENWAIKSGEFGGVLNNNFIEFKLKENLLTSNPSIVSLVNGNSTPGSQQVVPLYSLFNYGAPITNANILPTVKDYVPSLLYPDAGYVNFNDVKMSAYFYSQLASAVDKNNLPVAIQDFYVRDYVWLADYLATWQVFTPESIGQVVRVKANLNDTATITFAENHNLNLNQIFAIVNFDPSVDGYFLVENVTNTKQVIVSLTLPAGVRDVTGLGIGLKFQSQRVQKPNDINNLPLLQSEFTKNTVWVDEDNDGGWAVYRKGINYQYEKEFNRPSAVAFGSAVAYNSKVGYLVGDAGAGMVYRYTYNLLYKDYLEYGSYTPTSGTTDSFGSVIVDKQNLYVISQPTSTPRVFIYFLNDTTVTDDLQLYQEITAPVGSTNFGSAVAMSGDTNWLYISDYDEEVPTARNKVQVYRKNNISVDAGSFVNSQVYQITELGNTDFTLIGADENKVGLYFVANGIGSGTGKATQCDYVLVNTIDSGTTTIDKFGHSLSTNYYGDILTVGAPNENYDMNIKNWGRSYVYTRTVQNIETQLPSTITPTSFELAWTPDIDPNLLYVSKNGILVDSSEYSISGDTLVYSGEFIEGDIINVSGTDFTKVQTLTTQVDPRIGVQFGYSLDVNKFADELLVGAPFALSTTNQEGAAYRYTNGGSKYGIIIGTEDCDVTTNRNLLINGYLVVIPAGSAEVAADAINEANITNIQANNVNGKLVISLIDESLATAEEKITLNATDEDTFIELGISLYTQTQTITCPHKVGPTQFGTVVKFNEFDSVVISAPVGTRFAATTFDFVDDENLDNDTIFDNNATRFIDTYNNAGAVYMFDYLSVYNENLSNTGSFVYAQSVNARNEVYGSQPRYGLALDFNENVVVVGAPNFRPDAIDGQVVTYVNNIGVQDWSVYRKTSPIVDVNKITNTQLFNSLTNDTLINLDYFDPLQGKLLGVVRQNIDVVSNVDPAGYNSQLAENRSLVWGADKVGTIWFDTTNVRFVNYHQNDIEYNSRYWGNVFPGSDIAIYSWVASNVPPAEYQGPGTVRDITEFTIQVAVNAANTITPVYYFWVRNSNIIFREQGKTLADSIIAYYISNPLGSGVSYLSPLLPNAFALYNSQQFINDNDTVLHIGYSTGSTDDPSHSQFSLIRENYPDDFLPGLPGIDNVIRPESLYDRMLDSLSGVDETGQVVPNPFLPKAVQSGVLARPRQSFFYDRFDALKNYIQFANSVLKQFPITEIRTSYNFLFEKGEFYNTELYWEFVNWWVEGYDNNTKAALQVPVYADLSTLNVNFGTIVSVASNGVGKSETYRYDGDGVWTRIGLQNGTIQFKSSLYDYEKSRLGFGDNFFDTTPFDEYPSEETRWIVRAINEQLFVDDLAIFRNKSLILLFEYIQSETIESQNFLPWLNKTSLVDVSHKIRELKPIENFQSDNQDFLSGYLNETKPYHVVIKEFVFNYTGEDIFEGDITDFDLPAKYNTQIDRFVSPQLKYSQPEGDIQYLPNDPIWQEPEYNQWFNNYGLSLTGQDNYLITTLDSYMTLGSNSLFVANASGFPINGTIRIGSESIGYNSVNRATNELLGLTRGLNETEITEHIPGEEIYIDLPPVVLLDGGRGYAEPPRIEAYIDTTLYPEPREPAILEAIMGVDSVIGINVVNPGSGYAVLPEIIIDPAERIIFAGTDVNDIQHSIQVFAPTLQTGDLVRYQQSVSGNNINKLQNGQWYYVNVLTISPTVIALYTNYADAVNDQNRIQITSTDSETDHILSAGAKASTITSSYPIRENNITIKFDRTTYTSQIVDWESGNFYGSSLAENYLNTEQMSSSGVKLRSTRPAINSILASAQGMVFDIEDVDNRRDITWSSFVRNVLRLQDDEIELIVDSNEPNASGSTIGFYIGMPIKLEGDIGPTLVENQTYYVSEISSDTTFKIALTEAQALVNDYLPFNNYLPSDALDCFTAKVTDTAILTVNYPGIRTVTQSTNNTLTIPLTDIGTGGTQGLYSGQPIFFTGNVFGGVEVDQVYYVTAVVDEQNFTLSTIPDPVTKIVSKVDPLGSLIYVNSTSSLSVNDPVIFNSAYINDQLVETFGNISVGQTYYIASIIVPGFVTISDTIGGLEIDPGTAEGEMLMISQKDILSLTPTTGNMTINISLPISPGQVNGQQFTIYPTSQQYADVTANITTVIEREIAKTFSTLDRVVISTLSGGIEGMYIDFPIEVESSIGGLTSGTTYYVTEIGVNEVEVTSATSVGNLLISSDTSQLYENMPVTFSGSSFGGVVAGTTYYVGNISVGSFNISTKPDWPASTFEVELANSIGFMLGTGEPFVTVSTSKGGSTVTLTDADGPVTLMQDPLPNPEFDVSYILGGYRVIINDGKEGYAIDNVITIPGSDIGGTTPANDLVMTVSEVDSDGSITKVICSGTPAAGSNKYYLKVISANEFEVYQDPLFQVPVSGLIAPFGTSGYIKGFTTTTATSISSDVITVNDIDGFSANDGIVFTGNVFGDIELGKVYYVGTISGSTLTILDQPNGTVIPLTNSTGTMTMAKAGSFMLLPEPFYFNQSIVKYNDRIWACVISNNDEEFTLGKWELLSAGDNRLNAMDRVVGWYKPTINMPGIDLTQLFEGVEYPNSTYYGNDFEPSKQFELDTILKDQEFDDNSETDYIVKGDKFLSGYGPEELVPGVVSDNLNMIVKTRAGTNWPSDIYGHVGYNVVSLEFNPNINNEYNFDNIVAVPTQISVFVIDGTTGLSTSIYNGIDYSVDWINKTVTLNTNIAGSDKLRIDVYETGNGNQLAKSNTDNNPVIDDEILLDCSYSAPIYAGNGPMDESIDPEPWTVPLVFKNGIKLEYGVSNDYYIGETTDSRAKLVFNQPVDTSVDYIAYTVLGRTDPFTESIDQFGYTIPETETFMGNNTTLYNLSNYIGGDNELNAVVEINGVRVNTDQYTFNLLNNTITFNSAIPNVDLIAVTTYNDTARQSLNTQTFTSKTVANITFIDTSVNIPTVRITTGITHNLLSGDIVRIAGVNGSVQLNNNLYYVDVIDPTTIDIYLDSTFETPVILVAPYISGGYVFEENTFVIVNDWELTNVDRLWVTINGYRVPSTSLVLNANNDLSILSTITASDTVIITSMIPTATPNEKTFLLNVNNINQPSVYRINPDVQTWLTQELLLEDDTIYLGNVAKVISGLDTNLIYVNGELIRFTEIDLENNTISGLQRGVNGTVSQVIINNYSTVYGILPDNKLSTLNYNEVWNSTIFSTELVDPLQLSTTSTADFLNKDTGE